MLAKAVDEIEDGNSWFDSTDKGFSREFYRELCLQLAATSGFFSLAYIENPFEDSNPTLNWDDEWKENIVHQFFLRSWLNCAHEWFRGDECRKGRTIVRLYQACAKTLEMLNKSECIFDWDTPRPENFAAFSSLGLILCYSISHEHVCFVHRSFEMETKSWKD